MKCILQGRQFQPKVDLPANPGISALVAEMSRVGRVISQKSFEYQRIERLLQDYRPLTHRTTERGEYILVSLHRQYHYAQLTPEAERKILTRIAATTLVGAVLFFLFHYWLFTLLGAFFALNEYLRLCQAIKVRTAKFEKDYTAFLLSLASSVKTGLDPLSAMIRCSVLFQKDSEVKKQLDELRAMIEGGMREEEALLSFAKSIPHPDLGLFRNAMILSRQEGSSLSECLRRLAKVTRQRQSFRRRTRSGLAMQRMSSWGIMGCGLLVIIGQLFLQPDTIKAAWHDPLGHTLLLSGALCMLLGFFILSRLGKHLVD